MSNEISKEGSLAIPGGRSDCDKLARDLTVESVHKILAVNVSRGKIRRGDRVADGGIELGHTQFPEVELRQPRYQSENLLDGFKDM